MFIVFLIECIITVAIGCIHDMFSRNISFKGIGISTLMLVQLGLIIVWLIIFGVLVVHIVI